MRDAHRLPQTVKTKAEGGVGLTVAVDLFVLSFFAKCFSSLFLLHLHAVMT